MKIHVHCPGLMNEGLDSPSRGESRWTQNLARLLAEAGHEVVITASGNPVWGSRPELVGITLVPETRPKSYMDNTFGVFDVSMDSACWKGKPRAVSAKRYLILKWSLEEYMRATRLQDDEFLCFPHRLYESSFFLPGCVNADKTFLLPLPFGDGLSEPNSDKDGLLWTSKDIDRVLDMRDNAKRMAERVVPDILGKYPNMYVVWLMHASLKKYSIKAPVRDKDIVVNDLVPYYKIREILSECKLVVAVNIPGSVFDAAFLGVPTLEWEVGGFFNDVGRKHDVLLEEGCHSDRIKEVILNFLTDESLYCSYVRDIQDKIKDNTNSSAIKHFNRIVKEIM